jgi:hypothetical protein
MWPSFKVFFALTMTNRLFGIFISKFSELACLRRGKGSKSGVSHFMEDDDLSLALYYVRSLSTVLRWAPEAAWEVLAKRVVRSDAYHPPLSEISKLNLTPDFLSRAY